jgi:hypothetical protein
MPHDHPHPHDHRREGGLGHNQPGPHATQWQGPLSRPGAASAAEEPDFDLVEEAFCEAAAIASDPTSFLRLAGVPFVADLGGGNRMRLLSFSIANETEVGAIAPGFAAADPVYHPLPASRVRKLRRLRFTYHTAEGAKEFSLSEVRNLPDFAQDQGGSRPG